MILPKGRPSDDLGRGVGSQLHRDPQALLPSAKKYAYDENRRERKARNEADKAEESGLRERSGHDWGDNVPVGTRVRARLPKPPQTTTRARESTRGFFKHRRNSAFPQAPRDEPPRRSEPD